MNVQIDTLYTRGGTTVTVNEIRRKQYKRRNDSIKGEKTVGTDSILSTPLNSDTTLFYLPPYEQLSLF